MFTIVHTHGLAKRLGLKRCVAVVGAAAAAAVVVVVGVSFSGTMLEHWLFVASSRHQT